MENNEHTTHQTTGSSCPLAPVAPTAHTVCSLSTYVPLLRFHNQLIVLHCHRDQWTVRSRRWRHNCCCPNRQRRMRPSRFRRRCRQRLSEARPLGNWRSAYRHCRQSGVDCVVVVELGQREAACLDRHHRGGAGRNDVQRRRSFFVTDRRQFYLRILCNALYMFVL